MRKTRSRTRPPGRGDFLRRALFFACAGLALLVPRVQAAAAASAMPAPEWLETVRVSEFMVINGLPSEVRYFKTDKGVERVMEFYRHQWNDLGKKPGYKESAFGPWHIISRLEGYRLHTVQARQNGPFGTEGYLATADTRKKSENTHLAADVPIMKGSSVINDLVSRDAGKSARTMLVVNGASVESNSAYYRNYYRDRGWGSMMDLNRDGSQVLVFGRLGREAHLVISRGNGLTSIVMNLVEN